jgi:hypothetical protein
VAFLCIQTTTIPHCACLGSAAAETPAARPDAVTSPEILDPQSPLAQLQRRTAEKNCVVIKNAADRQHATVTEVQQLPKHLQEFLAFTRADQGGGESRRGVEWRVLCVQPTF